MRSRHRAFAAAWIGFTGLLSVAGADANLTALQGRWAARMARPESAGTLWGAQVVSLRSGKVWIETNAAVRMTPASNTKLVTAALALDRLGVAHRRITSLRIASTPDASGRLPGPLRLVGGGDPTLAPQYHGGSWERVWKPLVDAVQQAGIRRVDGGLLCDEGSFRGPPYGSGWAWEDFAESYGAAVSALTAGNNVATLVVTPGAAVGAPAAVRLDPFPDLLSLNAGVRTAPAGSTPFLQLLRLPGASR
ncbi:MAG: D-alanyl-D-alanine carboxypeptidase, partial [Verrucomicrobiae bacterium]|nr:D-alanyl-D-alanine carboxypeptidase [Verrucomicrobiae bacterium]